MKKKRIMALALAAVLASGTPVFASGSFADFKDYNKDLGYGKLNGHWAQSNIKTLYEKGGISGYPEGDFRANKTISGAELIALILNASDNGENMVGDSWSDKIMNRAYELGMVTPSDISKADANKPISREKMALTLVNSAYTLFGEDTTRAILVPRETISDLSTADVAYQDKIVQAYTLGLLAGDGTGFSPKASTSRAEAASIICRLFDYTDRVEVKYEVEIQQPKAPTGEVPYEDRDDAYYVAKADEHIVELKATIHSTPIGGWDEYRSNLIERFKQEDAEAASYEKKDDAYYEAKADKRIAELKAEKQLVPNVSWDVFRSNLIEEYKQEDEWEQKYPNGAKYIEVQYPALPDKSNVGIVSGYHYPAEGLIYNGKPITRDPETGVLGYGNGQKGGLYLGIEFKNGREIGVGSSFNRDGYDNMSGYYTERGGAVFFEKEWGLISQKVVPKLDAKYPNPELGAVADLYGNIIPGGKISWGKMNVDNAVFAYGGYGWGLISDYLY